MKALHLVLHQDFETSRGAPSKVDLFMTILRRVIPHIHLARSSDNQFEKVFFLRHL
jgi:hypothetical protein